MELGIALQSDKNILQLMKKTKQKFDKMKMSGNLIEASSLSRTTFNLAAVSGLNLQEVYILIAISSISFEYT